MSAQLSFYKMVFSILFTPTNVVLRIGSFNYLSHSYQRLLSGWILSQSKSIAFLKQPYSQSESKTSFCPTDPPIFKLKFGKCPKILMPISFDLKKALFYFNFCQRLRYFINTILPKIIHPFLLDSFLSHLMQSLICRK